MKYFFGIYLWLCSLSVWGQMITAPAPLTIEANASNVDAGDFVVNWANTTDQILVSISLEYHNGATFSLPVTTGLTLNTGYTSWTGITSIVFYGTRNNINTALAAMTMSMGSVKTAVKINLEVAFYDSNYKYNPNNKHFYRYVAGNITYANAKTGAATYSYMGKTGYLLTITSEDENNFVNNNIPGTNIWLALTDVTSEGNWIIDAGPELGTQIKTSNGQLTGNISGQYNNWCGGEPNDANNEDYATTKWNGGTCWNDLPNSWAEVQGYVVEISEDFPAGSAYTGVYATYTVHNNDIAYTLASANNTTLNSTTVSNYPNLFGGLQINSGNTVTLNSSTTLNTNKIIFDGTGKLVLTDNTSKWTPGTSNNLLNTNIHSPKTNSTPIYWSTSGNFSGDTFYTNAPYPTTTTGYHFTPWLNSPQGWSAATNDGNQNITLSYNVPTYITGIVTQGRTINGTQYVSNVNVDVSTDGSTWRRVLSGVNLNTNVSESVTTYFPNVEYAKFVKVMPTSAGWVGHITMKMGLLIKSSNIITDGLVLHLDAGNQTSYIGTGTSWKDLSGLGNHGTFNATPTYNIDKLGDFSFNGSTTQVTITDHATLEPSTGDWTMEACFQLANITTYPVILGKFNNGGTSNDVSYSIRGSTNTIFAQIGSGSSYLNSSIYTVSANTWYHVVFVWRNGGTKTIETYINGKLIGTVTHTLTGILNSANNLYIGRYNNGEFARDLSGKIGLIRLYKRALSASEVTTNFNASRTRFGL